MMNKIAKGFDETIIELTAEKEMTSILMNQIDNMRTKKKRKKVPYNKRNDVVRTTDCFEDP